MILLKGVPTWRQLVRAQGTGHNVGAVTVTNVETTVVSVALGALQANDLVFVNALLQGTKGATAGAVNFLCKQTPGGSGTLLYSEANSEALFDLPSVPIGYVLKVSQTAMFVCTGAGSPNVGIRARSFGSDLTVGDGFAEVRWYVIRGS